MKKKTEDDLRAELKKARQLMKKYKGTQAYWKFAVQVREIESKLDEKKRHIKGENPQ